MENDVERSAYIGWRFRYWPHKEADQFIEKLLPIKMPSQENWLKFCRESLLLSTNEMASRLGIAASSYKRIERDLPLGKVTLQKLQQAARAMDCELRI